MARPETGSVRMGPLSLVVLVVMICMAVLAVLSFATARASAGASGNQAEHTAGMYANEVAAQELVAQVDAQLAQVSRTGGTRDAAMQAVRDVVPGVARVEDYQVSVAFSCDHIRKLTVTLQVNPDLTYTVTKWKTSVDWPQDQGGQNYWTGKQ